MRCSNSFLQNDLDLTSGSGFSYLVLVQKTGEGDKDGVERRPSGWIYASISWARIVTVMVVVVVGFGDATILDSIQNCSDDGVCPNL